jgi:hypothetical protein
MDPCLKKKLEFFSYPDMTIHSSNESRCLKMVEVIFGPKKPKNRVKILLFKGRFEKSCFGF